MSKKRISTESRNDEQTSEDSDAVFQQVDSAKRGKLDSLSNTTLSDLPMEMLECILIKVIAMEVKNMKLAKSVWREKADLVISRFGTVCSQWSSVLTTNFFRNELHRVLDGIAQETIRLEVLQESLVQYFVLTITTMKDDVLIFCQHHDQENMTSPISNSYNIRIYDRNNMAEEKDVIELPGIRAMDIAACNVSKCVYVLEKNKELHCSSILRITKDEEQKFNIHTWISDLRYKISSISVSVKGSLIIISKPEDIDSYAVSIYDPNGFLHHEVMLSPEIYGFSLIESVIEKSNGNLVLETVSEQFQKVLTEIDSDWTILRQYRSSFDSNSCMNVADTSGRILIIDMENRTELLDSEFNLLEFTGSRPNQYDFDIFHCLHYNSERNEVMGICAAADDITVLRIFRFSEE